MDTTHPTGQTGPRETASRGSRRHAGSSTVTRTKEMTLVALFGALTAVSAVVAIPLPFTPVPITLQVMVTLLAGLVLGARLGMLSQAVYVLVGTVGVPVFAGGSAGLEALLGPTGGYLLGFIASAGVVGALCRALRGRPAIVADVVAVFAGVVAIYFFGAGQLAIVLNLPLSGAIVSGVAPFLVPDVFKGAGAVVLAQALRERRLGIEPRGAGQTGRPGGHAA